MVPKYDIPVWKMCEEAAKELPKVFSPADVVRKVREKRPEVKRSTLQAHVTAMSPNHPSSRHYSLKHDAFYYLGRGRYRLLKKDEHVEKLLDISGTGATTTRPAKNERRVRHPLKRHTERCPDCKTAIEELLGRVYGEVRPQYKFDVGANLGDYEGTDLYGDLEAIYRRLQEFRGQRDFVRSKSLPAVDYYVPNPGLVLEFDETQHFTIPRRIALQNYPKDFKASFSIQKWIKRCDRIRAKDNDPPFRDEQRAWYDTLRDFLPLIRGLAPTIRLFSKDSRWCSLNPEVEADRKRFMRFLRVSGMEHVDVRTDQNPSLARVVIAGEWEGDIDAAKKVLDEVSENWPEGKNVDCLITCGAFLTFDWPDDLEVEDNKFPTDSVLRTLESEARRKCDSLLTEELRRRLLPHTRYMTIGIDSYKGKISFSGVSIRQPHAEMVALVDLRTNQYSWTGKSFPTPGQEGGLVRFPDVGSHFVELPFGRIMILGCHDLSVFSQRGRAATKREWRKRARQEFYDMVGSERPAVVLHHPHTTDSSGTWTAAWNELVRAAPTVEKYVGAGRYWGPEGERSSLADVLRKTKLGETIDFIVGAEMEPMRVVVGEKKMRREKYRPGRLVLRKTYYLNGFFNETEKMPSFPRPSDDSNTLIVLECKGPVSSRKIQAVVKYRSFDGQGKWINQHHKARIYGGKNLADWFQGNFQVEEELRIEPIEKNRIYRVQS